jgi:dienelactone hydrolase
VADYSNVCSRLYPRFVKAILLLSWVPALFSPVLRAQAINVEKQYEEVFYQSGKLRIQAYLYKPQGDGPFPVVIYNHGSRARRERNSVPFAYIGKMLTASGYVVLVPERRGYGQSDGQTYSDAVGMDRGARFVDRMREETGDVLAAVEYLKTVPYADTKRMGIMGWSLGGIVTVFAASSSPAFQVAVDQAGASLTWDSSPAIRETMVEAAKHIQIPLLAMDAKNDRTTESVKAVTHELEKRKIPSRLIIYPDYTPPESPGDVAPGHVIFAAPGAHLWEDDVKSFLAEHLGGNSAPH